MLNKFLIVALCFVSTFSFSKSEAIILGYSQSTMNDDDPSKVMKGKSGYAVALLGAFVVAGGLTLPISLPVYTIVVGVVANTEIDGLDTLEYSVLDDTASLVEVGVLSLAERSAILNDVNMLQSLGMAFVFSPENFSSYVNDFDYTREEAFNVIAIENSVSKELVAYLASKSGIQ